MLGFWNLPFSSGMKGARWRWSLVVRCSSILVWVSVLPVGGWAGGVGEVNVPVIGASLVWGVYLSLGRGVVSKDLLV